MSNIEIVKELRKEDLNPDWIRELEKSKFIRDNKFYLRASELDKFINDSIFESRAEFMRRKLAGEEVPINEFMQAGIDFEKAIIDKTIEKLGLALDLEEKVEDGKYWEIGEVAGFKVLVKCKPDALAMRLEMLDNRIQIQRYIVEVKYMARHSSIKFDNDVPPWYRYQVYAYMSAYKRNAAFGALMQDGLYVVEKNLMREIENIRAIRDKILYYVAETLMQNIEAESSHRDDSTHIKKVIEKPSNNVEKLIAELVNLYKENKYIIDQFSKVRKQADRIKSKIKEELGTDKISANYLFENYEVNIQTREFYKPDSEKIKAFLTEEQYNELLKPITYKAIEVRSKTDDIIF